MTNNPINPNNTNNQDKKQVQGQDKYGQGLPAQENANPNPKNQQGVYGKTDRSAVQKSSPDKEEKNMPPEVKNKDSERQNPGI